MKQQRQTRKGDKNALQTSLYSYSLQTAIGLYTDVCRAKRLAPRSIRFYRDILNRFAEFARVPLEQVDAFTIRRYLLHRQDQVASPHTLHGDYRALRAFFRWAEREELIERNPMRKVDPPKTEVECKPILEQEQVQALLDACKGEHWRMKRDRALIMVLLDTGLRVGEVHQMTVENGLSENFIIRGKSKRDRLVCLSPQSRLSVRKYLNACPFQPSPDQPLWWGKYGALTTDGIKQVVKHVGLRAGIPSLGCHTFRRTFAVWSLRNGMSLEHLRELLGHRDFTMLKYYVQLSEQDLKQAHKQYSPVHQLFRGRRA